MMPTFSGTVAKKRKEPKVNTVKWVPIVFVENSLSSSLISINASDSTVLSEIFASALKSADKNENREIDFNEVMFLSEDHDANKLPSFVLEDLFTHMKANGALSEASFLQIASEAKDEPATELPAEWSSFVNTVFAQLDSNNDGSLTHKEIFSKSGKPKTILDKVRAFPEFFDSIAQEFKRTKNVNKEEVFARMAELRGASGDDENTRGPAELLEARASAGANAFSGTLVGKQGSGSYGKRSGLSGAMTGKSCSNTNSRSNGFYSNAVKQLNYKIQSTGVQFYQKGSVHRVSLGASHMSQVYSKSKIQSLMLANRKALVYVFHRRVGFGWNQCSVPSCMSDPFKQPGMAQSVSGFWDCEGVYHLFIHEVGHWMGLWHTFTNDATKANGLRGYQGSEGDKDFMTYCHKDNGGKNCNLYFTGKQKEMITSFRDKIK